MMSPQGWLWLRSERPSMNSKCYFLCDATPFLLVYVANLSMLVSQYGSTLVSPIAIKTDFTPLWLYRGGASYTPLKITNEVISPFLGVVRD
jgi:hypothetical protein